MFLKRDPLHFFAIVSQISRGISSFSQYPLIIKSFPNKNSEASSFFIKQLQQEEVPEAAALISEAFSTREMITKNFKISIENLYQGVKKDLETAAEANLCLICRDQATNKLAGVIYYEDLTEVMDPKIWQNNMIQDQNWSQLEEFYEYLYNILLPYASPKERNDVLLFKKLAVSQEFTRMRVATNLMFAARYLHPRTTKAKRRLMIASNEKTYKFCLKHGWQLIQEINVKDYNLMPHKQGTFALDGTVFLLKYEPKNGSSVIQEIKNYFEMNPKEAL